jgi:hypothetical protein
VAHFSLHENHKFKIYLGYAYSNINFDKRKLKMKSINLNIITLLFCLPLTVIASNHVGTISKLRGQVEILSGKTANASNNAQQVKYNGKYYKIKKASLGSKVMQGELVRTGKRSLAKIIFENGDQIMISPGSEYKLSAPSKNKKSVSFIKLTRGKLRAIISKEGPRNKMKVITRNASMAVRGTDFYVNAKGFDRSEVSVIRGKVTLKISKVKKNKVINIDITTNRKTVAKKTVKEVILETGYSANLISAPKLPDVLKSDVNKIKKIAREEIKETVIEVKRTSKQKLVTIDKTTKIIATKEEKAQEKKRPTVTKEVAKKIAKLEKKAINVTLTDIKTYTPMLYKEIIKETINSTDELNRKVVTAAHKVAPKAIKPDLEDLENEQLSDDVYNKYFDQD